VSAHCFGRVQQAFGLKPHHRIGAQCRAPGAAFHPGQQSGVARVARDHAEQLTAVSRPHRHRDDRGVVFILDSRVVKKGYGRMFLRSLPDVPVLAAPAAEVVNAMERFFASSNGGV
jgi:hypothetical protein